MTPAYQNAYHRRRMEELAALKARPCADCGVQYPPYVMDFDHVRGEKLFNVSAKAGSMARERRDAEIAKCDLVCANCHRIRTHLRRAGAEGNAR